MKRVSNLTGSAKPKIILFFLSVISWLYRQLFDDFLFNNGVSVVIGAVILLINILKAIVLDGRRALVPSKSP